MMKEKKINKTAAVGKMEKVSPENRPFSKINFYLMGACVALIIIGFVLMSGGSSPDESFNPEVFSTRRIVVGPLIAFIGFLSMAFAIMWQPKNKTVE